MLVTLLRSHHLRWSSQRQVEHSLPAPRCSVLPPVGLPPVAALVAPPPATAALPALPPLDWPVPGVLFSEHPLKARVSERPASAVRRIEA